MRIYPLFFVLIFYSLLATVYSLQAYAISDPTAVSNNKFGIHIATADEQDITDAAKLVNSSGGNWGYVTVTIQQNDREIGKWQDVFNKMRKLRLIPIIRIATEPDGGNWRKPTMEQAAGWAEFLNKLNWVVKNRYVILFNEPNHATEWGGEANPEEYADVAYSFASALKKAHPDFYIMLAGFDQAAPLAPPQYFDERSFLSRMSRHLADNEKDLFALVDGWSSHSYPNPGFVGSPYDEGKGTIRGYEWELSYLSELGVSKKLPVFITETGWDRKGSMDEERVAENYRIAYESVWLPDKRVVVVTPFILNYQGHPFLGFSLRKFESSEYYKSFETVADIPKVSGEPERVSKFEITSFLPTQLGADSRFNMLLKIRNTGQTIWDIEQGDEFALVSDYEFKYFFPVILETEPGVQKDVSFTIQTPETIGSYPMQIALLHNGKAQSTWEWQMKVIPNIDIAIHYSLGLGVLQSKTGFQVEIYDPQEHLVYKKSGITGDNGEILLKKVKNLAVGEKYRIVLLKQFNLPRQEFVVAGQKINSVKMKTLWPVDWDKNGRWTLHDLVWFIK
ncbi:MAG: hypothetical protein WC775_05755 [Patescibacteria group bacterium]|jgi:hypothetical protein